ncbi:MAG: STAS domain-containing protein [Pseudomonadota bacterium]
MKIEHFQKKGVDVLAVSGRIDATTSPDFEGRLMEVASAADGGVVLDFDQIDYVSSAGLRVLLVGVRALGGASHKLVVARPSDNVKEVITLTGFHKLLTICNSMDEAFEAVQGRK